jgi:hypothetical protein
LNSEDKQLVIDSKYKIKYGYGKSSKEDVRQLSGYARMENVYRELGKPENDVIDCLIIYPIRQKRNENTESLNLNNMKPIDNYVGFYRLGLSVPYITEIK